MSVEALTCQRCGAKYPRRYGRGRQAMVCDDCKPLAEADTRRRRFLRRFHIVDAWAHRCISCGEQVDHGESA